MLDNTSIPTCYNSRWLRYLVEDNSSNPSDLVPSEDGTFFMPLRLSGDEVVEIFSSLMYGAQQLYPAENQRIAWRFFELVEICSEVLLCFNDAEWVADFLQALADNGVGQGGVGDIDGTSIGDTVYGDLFAISDCNDDNELYGKALEAVETLNRLATDAFEIIEVITNAAELAAEMSDNIPIIAQSASFALEMGVWIQDSIAETYAAAYTAQTQQDLACAIYCVLKDECAMTIEGLIGAYNRTIAIELPNLSSFTDVMQWLLDMVLNTDVRIVGAMHLLILEAFNYASQFFGSTGFALKNAIANAAPAVSVPGCECGWCHEVDFANMVRYIPSGCTVANFGTRVGSTWIDTTRPYDNNCTGFGVTAIAIQYNFGGNFTVDEVEVQYTAIRADQNPSPDTSVYLRIFNDVVDTLGEEISAQFGSDQVMTYLNQFTDDHIKFEWWLGVVAGGDPTGADGTITKIILRGYTGSNPFGADNCT